MKKRVAATVSIARYRELEQKLADSQSAVKILTERQIESEALLAKQSAEHRHAIITAEKSIREIEASRDSHRERADLAIERAAKAEGYATALMDRLHPPRAKMPWEENGGTDW